MSYLAHGEWQAQPGEQTGPDWFAGRFRCDRLRDDILVRQGVQGLRTTHRADLLRTPIDGATVKRIELLCADRNIALEAVTGAAALDRPARAELDRTEAAAGEETSADGLWDRLRERVLTEAGRRSFGDPYTRTRRLGDSGRPGCSCACW